MESSTPVRSVGATLAGAGEFFAGGIQLDRTGPLLHRIRDEVRQALAMALVHDRREVGIRGDRRVEGCHGSLRPLHEVIDGFVGHEHVVGRDARLPGVEALAVHHAAGSLGHREAAPDNGRRLAAEFQRDGSEILGSRAHHMAADAGRAGEEKVVEGQPAERLRDFGLSVRDRDLAFGEMQGGKAFEKGSRSRGRFRHLHHGAVAGREGGDQGTYRQIERVIPGHDDAHHPERLGHHCRRAGLEPETGGPAFRPHPATQMAARVADALQGRKDLEQLRFVAGPVSEVARDGFRPFAGVFPHQGFEAAKALEAGAGVGKGIAAKCLAVDGEFACQFSRKFKIVLHKQL